GAGAPALGVAGGCSAARAAAHRDPRPLRRPKRPGPRRRGAPHRAHRGARRRTPCGSGVSGLLCWVCHLLSLPGRAAARAGYAAPGSPPQTCAGGQRRDRRGAGRNLSPGLPRRLASDRSHPSQVVRSVGIPAAAAPHGRSHTLCSNTGGAALSRIHVLAPGFLTTVQDLGRFGYAHFGISASGAADPLALRAGNLLVGNAENAPALEMTLTGGEFAFDGNVVISVTGSD